MNNVDGRGLLHAAIYGAVTVTVAYLVAHGSIVVFVGVMVGFGIAIRVWAIWYRRRHGLPLRRTRGG